MQSFARAQSARVHNILRSFYTSALLKKAWPFLPIYTLIKILFSEITTWFYFQFHFHEQKYVLFKKHEICTSQSGQVYVDFEGQSKARLKVVPLFYTQQQKALKTSLYILMVTSHIYIRERNIHTNVLGIKAKAPKASWPLQSSLQ